MSAPADREAALEAAADEVETIGAAVDVLVAHLARLRQELAVLRGGDESSTQTVDHDPDPANDFKDTNMYEPWVVAKRLRISQHTVRRYCRPPLDCGEQRPNGRWRVSLPKIKRLTGR